MEKGKIQWRENLKFPEAQEHFIHEAETKTELYLRKYIALPQSQSGHYINSDLMKETFQLYASSPENRKKYNIALHNSAAVLASELFTKLIATKKFKHCIFLTGAPGAGKSFFIQSLFLSNMITDNTLVFEINVTSPAIYEKINEAQKNGVDCSIIVVNAPLEISAENAVNRELEIGRNVGPLTIATIYSKLPEALEKIKEKYPNVNLGILNKKNNHEATYLIGFEHIDVLKYGTFEEIYQKLINLTEEFKKKKENPSNNEERNSKDGPKRK